MMIRKWGSLPKWMQIPEVEKYYKYLRKKKCSLVLKRLFDVILSVILLIVSAPVMLMIAIMVLFDSRGGIFFRQKRVTSYGRIFRIHKFRTMRKGAESEGSILARDEDERVTKLGRWLRKYRLDELPQLIDVLAGNMSFVGPRPQSVEFVKHFSRETRAVFLLPAGITSETTLRYLDEGSMLKDARDIDEAYIREILPEKMERQLDEMMHFSMLNDIKAIMHTIHL